MKYYRKKIGKHLIICMFGIIFSMFGIGYNNVSWAVSAGAKADVFSFKCRNKALKDVVDEISNLTGKKIVIGEKWEQWPVTVDLKQVSTLRALKRILGSLDHAIIYGPENKISVVIFGESDSGFNMPISSIDIEVVPPKRPGERGITQREYNQIVAQRAKIDPLDLEVVPPDKPGERGITQRELNAIKAKKKKIDSRFIEVVPPEEPGGKGVTQQEYEAIKASRKKVNVLDLEVVPPDKPGERGITQRELNKIKSVGSTE